MSDSPADNSLDLVGIGKLAKAIPDKSWTRLTESICNTFDQLVAPITETTGGIGRLIAAKFDRLIDAEKVLASEAVQRASEKVKGSGKKPSGRAKAKIVIQTITATATESDEVLRELWSNLLAQEIIDGKVHPEFPKILERLSSEDAQVLAEIAGEAEDWKLKAYALRLTRTLAVGFLGVALDIRANTDFTRDHLNRLGLIERLEGRGWVPTILGKEFIKAVSDPTAEPVAPIGAADKQSSPRK